MSSSGKLAVKLSSESMFLQDHLSWDVRDDAHEAVRSRLRGTQTLELPPGFYSVDAVHENGSRWTVVTEVRSGETADVSLFAPQSGPITGRARPSPMPAARHPLWLGGGLESFSGDEEPELVLASDGLHCTPNGRGVFHADVVRLSPLPAWACFVDNGQSLVVMLPVSLPNYDDVESRATIRFVGRDGDGARVGEGSPLRARVELDPRRRVFNALRSRVEHGMIGEASELARDATSLLLDKYSDPIGAAFGALFLHRIKQLDARADWVANLSNGFPWLRDAQVLRASLQARGSAAERAEGFARLRDALVGFRVGDGADELPRFVLSDALSLALSLLRRWPDPDEHRAEREDLVARFAPLASRYDYGSTFAQIRGVAPSSPAER